MFDGVELGAAGRIVQDENLQADSVCKIHKVLFDNMVFAGIVSASIAEDDKRLCIRIKPLQMIVPDLLDVVAH